MKRAGKAFLLFPLLLLLLFCGGCVTGDEPSASKASSDPAAVFSAPASPFPEESAAVPESSTPAEAPTYYFDESHGESLQAKILPAGVRLPNGEEYWGRSGFQLPDERIVTSEGVLMPDGTLLYQEEAPFQYVQEDRDLSETVMTLPDGTRVVAPTYYFNNDVCDCPVAKMVEGKDPILGGRFYDTLLPDGRRITSRGVLLPDGTTVYQQYTPFWYGYVRESDPEVAMTLPDGTRIVAKQYFMGSIDDEALLVRVQEGIILLPDGRYYTKEGVFLPDGTRQFTFEEITPYHYESARDLINVVTTFPDGTRLVNPYGMTHVISSEPCPACGEIHTEAP